MPKFVQLIGLRRGIRRTDRAIEEVLVRLGRQYDEEFASFKRRTDAGMTPEDAANASVGLSVHLEEALADLKRARWGFQLDLLHLGCAA